MTDRISKTRVSMCGGKDSVILTMSTTQPKRTCKVDQVKSPVYRFFRDSKYFQFDMSFGSIVRNTLSSVWNNVCRTWCHLWVVPWARLKNSLTKTST